MGQEGGQSVGRSCEDEAAFREMFFSLYRAGNCSSQTVKGDILIRVWKIQNDMVFDISSPHPDSLLLKY